MRSSSKPRSPRRAPALAADLRAPFPDVAHAVLAEVEDDVALLLLQQVAHQRVGLLELRQFRVGVLGGDLAVGAPVVLQEVEAPIGELLGVLRLVLVGAGEAGAGAAARARCRCPAFRPLAWM